jgi:TatD DNase family protein
MSEYVDGQFDCSGIFDSHAHYFDKRFENETDGADAVLRDDVFGRGIDGVINVATNNDNAIVCIEQAKKYEKMYVAVGLHPEDVAYCKQSPDQELARLRELVSNTAKQNKIVAVGEIGLDYHYEGYNKALQAECFDAQMCMAKEKKLPVIIHDREAHGDCFDIVIAHPDVTGVFHSYSGSYEMAKDLIDRGWYISFSGTITFKNAERVREVAKRLPRDRVLIETDAPYLTPRPYRGKVNHSGYLEYTNRTLAAILGMSEEDAAALTENNARRFFCLNEKNNVHSI